MNTDIVLRLYCEKEIPEVEGGGREQSSHNSWREIKGRSGNDKSSELVDGDGTGGVGAISLAIFRVKILTH
jgi:hypothetical protein